MRSKLLLTALLGLPLAAQTGTGVINTVAGSDWVFSIPGGKGINAPLRDVEGLAVDAAGNLYAADLDNNLVVKLAPDGSASVVAGNNLATCAKGVMNCTRGFSGDGGPATGAKLNRPWGIAVDRSGALYIADSANHRIRKVDSNGIITTIGGTGHAGYSGDNGPAIAAQISHPTNVTLDRSGNFFFYDSDNARIRRIGTDGIITTVAGNGRFEYSGEGPGLSVATDVDDGIAADASGNIYFGDYENHIRMLTTAGVTVLVAGDGNDGFAGDGGPALKAEIGVTAGIALDSGGNIFFSDFGNGRIRRIDTGGIITTFAGTGVVVTSGDGGSARAAGMDPNALAFDSFGNLNLSDYSSFVVRRISPSGLISTIMGNRQFRLVPDGTPAGSAYFWYPRGLSIDPSGSLIVADSNANRIRRVTSSGSFLTIGGDGSPGCCQDGKPALQGFIDGPASTATDAAGNIYFTDQENHRVRKISTSGIISTVAGAGDFSTGGFYYGDGGPALDAYLNFPQGLAFDQTGNLYIADQYNHVIRKVDRNGTISTYAGICQQVAGEFVPPGYCTPVPGFSGDFGPAGQALFNYPIDVKFDSTGKLYVVDQLNNRVRVIAPPSATGLAGTITTFAGNGKTDGSGDGGPATQASLYWPSAIAFDSAGNAYITEYLGNRIRKVSTTGIITTIAGNKTGTPGFSGDGLPASLASIAFPDGSIAVSSNNVLYFTDTYNQRVRSIQLSTNFTDTLTATPSTLSFTGVSGGAVSPQLALSVKSSSLGLPFQIVTSTTSGAWLLADVNSSATPATINISADPSGLSPGTYQGTVRLISSYANPGQVAISVTFQVGGVVAGHLSASSKPLSFQFQAGAAAATAPISLTNTGSNALSFSAAISTAASGGNWLSVTPSSGSVSASAPVTLTVSANPGSLAAGVYTGSISLSSPNTSDPAITIPVTMVISAAMPVILISQTGLTFQAVQAGGNPLAQTVAVLNTGTGTMNWTATPQTLSGSGWLAVSQSSGTVARPFLDYSSVDVSVNAAGLAPGNYFGQVSFNAAGANNGPQIVSIVLNVYPAGTPLGPEVRPSGLVFIGTPTSAVGSQNVSISNRGTAAATFKSSDLVNGNVNWLSHVPAGGTVQLNTPSQITVQPDFSNRGAGVDKGAITVLFADGTIQTISVLSVVPPSGAGSSSGVGASGSESPRASGCNASSLVVQPTTLTDPSSSVMLSQGANLDVRVADNCGNNIDVGTVSATFSSKDSQLTLAHTGGGRWSKTWTPVDSSQNRVVVKFRALAGQGTQILSGSASVTVALQSAVPQVPVTSATANAASFASTFVAPGGFISIFGQEMTGATSESNTLPLPSQVNGTQVLMAGRPLPLLYVAPGQINAQVPFNLAVNSTQQLVVMRGSSISVPQDVVVAAAQPAVYTQDASGTGPGSIQNASNNSTLVTAANPAQAGDVVVIYCNGLGAVSPPVPEGVGATGLSSTVSPLTATIGGIPATVQFAGLTPGIPGLYQVNAVVPAGLPSGTQVPVVLTIAGQSSPPVTMAVQ